MKKFFVFAAFVAVLVSCGKEMTPVVETEKSGEAPLIEGQTVVGAGISREKTYMDADYKLYWNEDDAIQVNGANSTSISIDPDDASRAYFTIGAVIDYPYCAVYPAAAASSYSDCQATVTVPGEQTYREGTFDPDATVLLAYAEEGGLHFKSAVSILKLTVEGGDDSDALVSIRVRANDGTALSGDFNATFGAEGCTLLSGDKDYSEMVIKADTPVAQGTPIYIAIPAQTYPEGINIFMVDENDHWCQAVSSKSFTAEPGAVYPTTFKFNNNGDYEGTGIYTASDWLLFASLADGDAEVKSQTPDVSTGNGDYSRFQDEDGVVNMYADVNIPLVDWSASAIADRIGSITNWSTVFDGHNHTLSADKWKIAVFQFVFNGGVIKNLKVDTENFVPRSASGYGGCCLLAANLAGGEINNCENNADLMLSINQHVSMSGICRVVYSGKIINCTNNGNLVLTQSSKAASYNDYSGGICSIIGKSLSDFTVTGPIEISGCVNNGVVGIELTEYDNPQQYVSVGGIVGWLTSGTTTNYAVISNCTNNGSVYHKAPTSAGASYTSSSTGGIIGIAYTPNPKVSEGSSSVPGGRTIDYMYGGKALNGGDKILMDGPYFEMTGCVNNGSVTNSNHIHGTVGSGTIRQTVNAGGLAGVAIGMKDKHAKITGCKNYGTVKCGNTRSAVARSFCNTVLGGFIGHAGSLDLDGCVFKGQLGDTTVETYCTGGIFGTVLSSCSAKNCKLYFSNFYHTNAASGSFYYYGLGPGTVSTLGRDSGALDAYCAACSFESNSFGGHITAKVHSTNSAYAADTDIDGTNVSGYFYNGKDATNATVKKYTLSGTSVWDGNE